MSREWYHTSCGGRINMKKRKCKKCGKKWSFLGFYILDTQGLRTRTVKEPYDPFKRKPTSYARWGDRLPYVGSIAGKLPNWPRWLRIASFLGLLIIISCLVYFLWGSKL